MRPHGRIHCRCGKHRPVGCQQHGRGKIVGKPVRHLRHQIGRGRGDQHQIAVARQPDMADILFVLPRKQIEEHMVRRQRTDGQRRDEFLRPAGHHRAHAGAALAQPADQIQALIGGDAARDDEEDAFSAESHGFFYPSPFLTGPDPKPLAENMQSRGDRHRPQSAGAAPFMDVSRHFRGVRGCSSRRR